MDLESFKKEKIGLEKKIKTLRQQKEKLSGSKNKRERAKVNKQISQTQRKLDALTKERDRSIILEADKEVEEKKKLEKERKAEKQKRDDKDYVAECEKKHQLKDATLEQIRERIEARKSSFHEFHQAEFWDLLIEQKKTAAKEEQAKQAKFLKTHNLTQAQMDETIERVKERRKKEAEEKAKAESETKEEAEKNTAEAEESAPTEQTEEVVFLDETAEDIPKPFPGYKANENSDSDGPEKAGPSEGPEEASSEKPLEPIMESEQPPEVEAKEEEVEAKEKPKVDPKKNYGSSQYWDERYEKYANKSEEWYEGWKTLKPIISPFISKDMMILDFGCGDSFMQDELQKDGFEVSGTDISDVVLKRLSEKPEHEMFTADGFAMPLRANSYDAIIDKGTLDAIACDMERDLTPLFEEIYRVLAPGGRYLCITPWQADKRIPQLNAVPWTITHEVMPMSHHTLSQQRFNQLKDHPKLGKDRKLLATMSARQAQAELDALNIEEAKNLPPERSCVIHCYVCQKTSA